MKARSEIFFHFIGKRSWMWGRSSMTLSIALLAFVESSCGRDWEHTRVPISVLDAIGDRDRVTDPVHEEVEVLTAVFEFSLPDSLLGLFNLSRPSLLTAEDAPACRSAVWDRMDRAIHVFDADGKHLNTIFGNGRNGVPRLEAVNSLDLTALGEVVAVTADGAVHRFDSTGMHLGSDMLNSATFGPTGFSAVVADTSGFLFQHWFFQHTDPSNSTVDIAGESLIRVWDRTGQLVGGLGQAQEWPGASLSYWLNRGLIALHDDTLWFARRSDARVFAFDANGRVREPSDTILLPVFFEAGLPSEKVFRSGRASVRMQEHISGFAMDQAGRFYFVQNVSWPDPEDEDGAFLPESTIVVVNRNGVRIGVYVTGQTPDRISVTRERIFVSGQDEMGVLKVRAYSNPVGGQHGVRCSVHVP